MQLKLEDTEAFKELAGASACGSETTLASRAGAQNLSS